MSSKKRSRLEASEKLEVILVCCGEPKKSMGWFHLTQLLADERVRVSAVVEPWFLGAGKGKPGSEAFAKMRDGTAGVDFFATVDEVPPRSDDGAPRLFLLAGRTCDAPSLFSSAIERGATHVYIEKPGAESAEQLISMRTLADKHGVAVIVGYNKNVAEYSRDALVELRALRAAGKSCDVTLEHCNAFSPGEELVSFLRGPGGEGMLHNMCCHELALSATLFGVSCARLRRVTLERARSELVDLGGGRGDWQRVAFRVELDDTAAMAAPGGGVSLPSLTFSADRCGGNFSRITLKSPAAKRTEFRLPTVEMEKCILKAQAEDPDIRPYFLQQAPDYERLKGVFVQHIISGEPGIPDGVVGLDGAIEALRLADLLGPVLKDCWASETDSWVPPT